MKPRNNIFNNAIVYHLLVIMLLLVPHAIYTTYIAKKDMSLYFLNMVVNDGFLLLIIYINIYYLIPVFQKRKRYVMYLFLLGIMVAAFVYVSYQLQEHIQKVLEYGKEPIFYFIVSTIVNVVQYLLISFFLFNTKEKFAQEKRMGEMKLENLKTEISYLRAQINPHFLFNTLNNLYGLALERSDKTPEIIMRLSKMMDYMLYESDDAMVYLKKDIENIENYIAIEKIRQGNDAIINYKYKQEGVVETQKIVPLLLLPLIENGFKHGVNKQIRNALLDINLEAGPHSILLKVSNSYKTATANEDANRPGIGLVNLKRRLELFYPGKYELVINKQENKFEASLKIDLS